MKKLLGSIVSALVVVVFLAACGAASPTPQETAPVSMQPEMIIAEGRVQPVNEMAQSFAMPGQVAEVLVADGEPVNAGQVLARLATPAEMTLALARAQQEALAAQQALDELRAAADLNLAQVQLALITAQEALDEARDSFNDDPTEERQLLLDEAAARQVLAIKARDDMIFGRGVDPQARAAAEARLAAADAAVASAQAAIDGLELRSTHDGVVVDLSLQAGQRVSAGQPVITVADFSQWVVKTDNLTELDVVSVRVGQPVGVILDALPGEVMSGEVTHINARYEEKRGDITYTVTVKIDQPVAQIRWGMTAAVQITP